MMQIWKRTVKRRLLPYLVSFALVVPAAVSGLPVDSLSRVDAEVPKTTVPTDTVPIPKEAIRFRVLAHSNTVADQWVKKQVKEAVMREMETWLADVNNAEEARQRIQERLEDIRALADDVLRTNGFLYRSEVTFGEVAFPAASYWNQRFASGHYEALRITLGDGRGDNFWCIMFPPLCFGSPADAWGPAVSEPVARASEPASGEPEAVHHDGAADAASASEMRLTSDEAPRDDHGEDHHRKPPWAVEFRFLIWDWIRGWWT